MGAAPWLEFPTVRSLLQTRLSQAIKIVTKLDLTLVHQDFDADVFFPTIDLNIWQEVSREDYKADENNKYDYSFVSYLRK